MIHMAVDGSEKDFVGVEITTADWDDNEMLPGPLEHILGPIAQVSAYGAYDTEDCH